MDSSGSPAQLILIKLNNTEFVGKNIAEKAFEVFGESISFLSTR
jgi:hypothetical protein